LKKLVESETQARWRVVEEAWKNKLSPNLLEYNKVDGNFYSVRPNERVYLRSAVSVLIPYQKGRCFYCNKKVSTLLHKDHNDFADVDHFLPLSFLDKFDIKPVNPNGIWNLVVGCRECNRGKKGKFTSPPEPRYFDVLKKRNVLFVEEHRHSMKNSILISLNVQTTKEVGERMNDLHKLFDRIKGWEPQYIYP
jgi:hypothetical protein